MDECLEAHGFAIIKDVLPEEIVEQLKAWYFAAQDGGSGTGRQPTARPVSARRGAGNGGSGLHAACPAAAAAEVCGY